MAMPQRFPTSIGGPAAVDGERVPIDKCALLVVSKKRDCECNILRGCEPAHRYAASDVCVGVGATRLVGRIHLGLNPAGANGVYAYTSAAPLRGERPREANQTMFRR